MQKLPYDERLHRLEQFDSVPLGMMIRAEPTEILLHVDCVLETASERRRGEFREGHIALQVMMMAAFFPSFFEWALYLYTYRKLNAFSPPPLRLCMLGTQIKKGSGCNYYIVPEGISLSTLN